jgi:hypothetical protein
MSNETPAAIDPDMFAAVFSENWDNARYIKSERISFMNAYSVICAGVLALLQSVQASDLIRIALLFFMTLFSLVGLLTSLRLKSELEECLAKIEAMTAQAKEPVCGARPAGRQAIAIPKVPLDLSNLLRHDDRGLHYTDRVSSGHRRSHKVIASQ